jgi:hypothetical protein
MSDFYLKAADEQALQEVLAPLGMYIAATEDCPARYVSNARWAIDVIGTIYVPTGNTTTTGGYSYAETAPIPGFHANVRFIGDPAGLDKALMATGLTIPQPNKPARVWA